MMSQSDATEVYSHFETVTIKFTLFFVPLFLNEWILFFDVWSKYVDNIAIIPYDVINGELYLYVDNKCGWLKMVGFLVY